VIRLRTTFDGAFAPLSIGGQPSTSVQAVVTDEGVLSRSYYNSAGKLLCWSTDSTNPDKGVPLDNRQSPRCVDCTQNIKGPARYKAKTCKFYTMATLVLEECKTVCNLRISGGSLFARKANRMPLYAYRDYLQSNGEKLGTVLTEIYFVEANTFPVMYFKPVRPLSEEELGNIGQLLKADVMKHNLFKNSEGNTYMKNPVYLLKNVKAKYPRIDKPYKYDSNAGDNGGTIPCEAMDANAKYETSFVLDEDQAKKLYKAMSVAYTEGRDDSWEEKLQMPFKKQEDGSFLGKANLKGAYKGVATGGVPQFDADNKMLDKDFQLTSGSTINLSFELVPYKMSSSGVSLRLRGVQVIDYAPLQSFSPFEAEKGFTSAPAGENKTAEDMFGIVEEEEEVVEAVEAVEAVEEAVKEPVKRASKKEKPATVSPDMASIIDDWGSELD